MGGNIECMEKRILKSLANRMWKLEFLSLSVPVRKSAVSMFVFFPIQKTKILLLWMCLWKRIYKRKKIFLENVTAFSCVSVRFKIRPNDVMPLVLWALGPLHGWTPGCATMDGAHFWGPIAWLQSGVMEVQSIQTITGVMPSLENAV